MEWPGRDYTSPPKGYLYLVFEEEGDSKEVAIVLDNVVCKIERKK